MYAVLVLLSLTTDCAVLTFGPENAPSPEVFPYFFCSSGDECHKFFIGSSKFAFILEGTCLLDVGDTELFASTGVGSTYELNFRDKVGRICLNLSLESHLSSAKSGADWLADLALKENEFLRSLSKFSYTLNNTHIYKSSKILDYEEINESRFKCIKRPPLGSYISLCVVFPVLNPVRFLFFPTFAFMG